MGEQRFGRLYQRNSRGRSPASAWALDAAAANHMVFI
jgi:hypothetical protein